MIIRQKTEDNFIFLRDAVMNERWKKMKSKTMKNKNEIVERTRYTVIIKTTEFVLTKLDIFFQCKYVISSYLKYITFTNRFKIVSPHSI